RPSTSKSSSRVLDDVALGAADERRDTPGDAEAEAGHDRLGRAATLIVTVVPIALLGFAVWRAWGGALHWQDLFVMGVGYALTGLGITVGFHRLFTHRS